MPQAAKSKTVCAMQTKPATTNTRTPDENDLQVSIPSEPSISETEDPEETVSSQDFPTCSTRDCVITEPKRTTSTTVTTVPDSMELIESCDSGSTTPAKNHQEKGRDDSDGEYETSENFDELIFSSVVQCAGWMGSQNSQMTDLKQSIETCIVPNHKNVLIEAKEAAIACKKMAITVKNNVDLALEKYREGEVSVAECDLPDSVSKDPGLRPLITTE